MKQYKIYLFDFDGTLFNTLDSLIPVYKYSFEKIGESCTDEDVQGYIHYSIEQVVVARKMPQEKWKPFGDAILESLDFKETIEATKIFDDSYETVLAIKKKGIPVSIVTGNTDTHVRLVLEHFNMAGFFGPITGNESFKNHKPDPEPILNGLKKFGIEPSHDCVYVGDSLQDVECAANAGVDGILIDRNDTYKDFKGTKIRSLKELI